MIFAKWCHLDTITLMAMTIRLTPDEEIILERLAKQLNLSKQKALIEAMLMAENHSRKKRDLEFARKYVMTHDKDLMERLADA
ncbi:hypothetical protein SAMN05216534_0084 [Candidatus Aquiluna sp. UB-MaderosW2red]|nr:hypothetical protein SAMN05216534_0084 [Candidatus Aquiluna sp. UB-MaderosW2red]